MKTELDISKVIEETQTLVHDERMQLASEGERQIQVLESEDGKQYQLSVTLKLIN